MTAAVIALAVAIPGAAFAAPPASVAAEQAGAPEADAIKMPRMIVIATVDGLEAGRREARRAAKLLGHALAVETLEKAPARREYVGAVITLLRRADGRIAVTTYLGDDKDTAAELEAVRKAFPKAVSVATTVRADARGADEVPFFRTGLLIVGSHGAYRDALAAAKAFSAASGIAYDSQGMIYDAKRGLILPDDADDDIYAGQYVRRRYDTCGGGKPCVTVERSEAYEGFRPGLYIVVAGVVGRGAEADERLKLARKIVPSAYIKQTTLYMGCIH
jgi:hypothetical protein